MRVFQLKMLCSLILAYCCWKCFFFIIFLEFDPNTYIVTFLTLLWILFSISYIRRRRWQSKQQESRGTRLWSPTVITPSLITSPNGSVLASNKSHFAIEHFLYLVKDFDFVLICFVFWSLDIKLNYEQVSLPFHFVLYMFCSSSVYVTDSCYVPTQIKYKMLQFDYNLNHCSGTNLFVLLTNVKDLYLIYLNDSSHNCFQK